MKHGRKVMAMVMSMMLLISLLAGCGKADTGDGIREDADGVINSDVENTQNVNAEEYPTVSLMVVCGSIPTDTDMVSEKLSEITREKIGCNVEIIPIEFGNWATQLNLLLSGGDDTLDVFVAGGMASYSSQVMNGQTLKLDDLMQPYEKEMREALGDEVYDSGVMNGNLYGIGRLLDQASLSVFNIRKDIADEFGYSTGDVVGLDGLDELFAKIKEKYPDQAIIGPSNGASNFKDCRVDSMSDEKMLGVLVGDEDAYQIVNYYESDEYLEAVSYFEKWKEMGCYMSDMLNSGLTPSEYFLSGQALGCFSLHFSPEMSAIATSLGVGVEVTSLQVFETAYAIAPTVFYSVNPACKNPKEAAGLIYLMATDADVENILINGIEGVHYQIKEDGTAGYLDGKDESSTGWCVNWGACALNSTLSIPFEYPADYYEQMLESNEKALKTAAFGFKLNPENVADEYAACSSVVSQYKEALATGSVENYEDTLEMFQNDLKAAGIDKVIQERQVQFEQFLNK